MANARRSLSDDTGADFLRDVGRARSGVLRHRVDPRHMELSATDDFDLGCGAEQEKAKSRARDVKTLAQIMKPILGEGANTQAQKLLTKFNSLNELFQNLSRNDIRGLDLSHPVAQHLKLIADSFARIMEREVLSGPVLPNSTILHDYLFSRYSALDSEIFRVLYLDAANRLIEDRLMGLGTVDRVQIYSRQVVKAALDLNAASIILVHNHPSGDPKPSSSDLVLTKRIVTACETFELEMIDHLIVARSGISSLRGLGLLDDGVPLAPSPAKEKRRPGSLVEACLQSVFEIIRKS